METVSIDRVKDLSLALKSRTTPKTTIHVISSPSTTTVVDMTY